MSTKSERTSQSGSRHWARTAAIAATALIAAVIAALTLAPSISPPPTGLALTDKAYHAIAFGALVLPAAIVFSSRLVGIAIAAFAYGTAIEVIQPFVGRDAEPADVVANSTGILLGIAVGWGIRTSVRAWRTWRSSTVGPRV